MHCISVGRFRMLDLGGGQGLEYLGGRGPGSKQLAGNPSRSAPHSLPPAPFAKLLNTANPFPPPSPHTHGCKLFKLCESILGIFKVKCNLSASD